MSGPTPTELLGAGIAFGLAAGLSPGPLRALGAVLLVFAVLLLREGGLHLGVLAG